MDPKNLKRCVVPFCDTRASSGLSKFPQKDENRKNIWLELLEIKEVKLNDRICHKHFTENDFQNFKNRRVLSPKAVPSLHLPQHIQISFHDDISLVQSQNVSSDTNSQNSLPEISDEPLPVVPNVPMVHCPVISSDFEHKDHIYSYPNVKLSDLLKQRDELI